MAEWKDETSYKYGERGEIEPRTWSLMVGRLVIVVTRIHKLDGWWLRFNGIDRQLDSTTADGAKIEVLAIVREYYRKVSHAIEELSND